jgi:hypothetical protein
VRIVTMDGKTEPVRTRLVLELNKVEDFRSVLQTDLARWINHGVSYTKYPVGFTAAQQLTEDDLKLFLATAIEFHDQNKQYLLSYCMHEDIAGPHDALQALIEQAKRAGNTSKEIELEEEQKLLLSEPSVWVPRRAVINTRSAQISQPGFTAGVIAGVSGNTEAIQNIELFPRPSVRYAEIGES